ncbi:hypothetical protein DXG03_003035 [Asterophora parasitica]|uniref:Uncharacterized protein n=1 Tax=Asterophora parasitica TaxID=117018 RepID=A0A9P7G3D4_9AGAR|nr:hypothetical protein DXG03_003035 [Asterophora parasitica]
MRDPLFFLNDESNNGGRVQEHEQQIPTREFYYTPQYDSGQDRTTYPTRARNNFIPGQQSTTATMGGVKPTITVRRKGPSAQHRRDRERQLLNTPAETLVQTLIAQEHDMKESRKLLRNAIARLDSMRDQTDMAEDARRTLEGEQRARGWQVTQSVMDAQGEVARARNDAEIYRLQLEWTQHEL